MKTRVILDIYNKNCEQYLKQLLLFNDKIEIFIPVFVNYEECARGIKDQYYQRIMEYKSFDNIEFHVFECKLAFLGIAKQCSFYKAFCEFYGLSSFEKECLYKFLNMHELANGFNARDVIRKYCGYIWSLQTYFCIYIQYYYLFKDIYGLPGANISTNTPFLHKVLSEKIEPVIDHSCTQLEEPDRENCEQCTKTPELLEPVIDDVAINQKALTILLPDYSFLPLEEMYELRQGVRDEILQLSNQIQSLKQNMTAVVNIDDYIEHTINTSIADFNRKVKDYRLATLQNFLKVRNLATAPLIATMMPYIAQYYPQFANLPAYIPLAASATIIGIDSAIQVRRNHAEIEKDPFYFRIKLNKEIRKRKP